MGFDWWRPAAEAAAAACVLADPVNVQLAFQPPLPEPPRLAGLCPEVSR